MTAASLKILKENRRTTEGHQYTVPSPTTYPYQWLWDSCFHAIALSHFDAKGAKEELRSLFAHQFDGGMIPHMIYWEPGEVINIKWGKERTSSITQPPLLAEAVWEIYQRDEDDAFLRECYTHLYHFYTYLLSERDPRHHHLAGIINPDESGEDNSPRFDALQGLPPIHTQEENLARRLDLVQKLQSCNFDAPFCMKNFFWVKDVPFNAILIKNLNILAKLSERIGYKEEGLIFAEAALHITEAMRDRMQEDGLFWSTAGENYEKIKVKTWAIFMPLYAHLLSQEEAATLVREHLLNPAEFKTTFMVPSVSKDEPSFSADALWRGPTWIAVNWFIHRGLLEYGFAEEAAMVLESSAKLLEQSGFREHYHPESGEGQGAENFTWGALIVDMLANEHTKPTQL